MASGGSVSSQEQCLLEAMAMTYFRLLWNNLTNNCDSCEQMPLRCGFMRNPNKDKWTGSEYLACSPHSLCHHCSPQTHTCIKYDKFLDAMQAVYGHSSWPLPFGRPIYSTILRGEFKYALMDAGLPDDHSDEWLLANASDAATQLGRKDALIATMNAHHLELETHRLASPTTWFGTPAHRCTYASTCGPPKIYLTDFPPVEEIFGLIKGTLRPPDRLYHPCIGIPTKDKLIHGLCETCAHEKAKTHCEHSNKQRDIKGVFVSEELKLCLKKGYKLVSISEVWHFEKRSPDLFKSFISRAYKGKIESSGWPSEIQELIDQHGMNDEQTREAIEEYKQKIKDELDIDICEDSVESNPASRSAAKLVLNNFWGFFAKAPFKEQTSYVHSLDKFYELLTTKVVSSYNMVNEDIMVVRWKESEFTEPPDPKVSVVIAAFTTAYARLRLYKYLELVGDRCLYMDTDSIIWINRKGEPEIESADLLGLMKNEITSAYGPQATIGAYGAAGPKSYTLMIINKDTGEVIDWHCRMKGISPTFKVDEKLSPEQFLHLIEKEYEIKVPQRTLHRDKLNTMLEWKETNKVIRSTFAKRLQPTNIMDPTDPIGSRPITNIVVSEH